jgi:hypothetical protein
MSGTNTIKYDILSLPPQGFGSARTGPFIIPTNPGASVAEILGQSLVGPLQPRDAGLVSSADPCTGWRVLIKEQSRIPELLIKQNSTTAEAVADESADAELLRAQENFRSELMGALRTEHIEDGMPHPSETILQDAFERNPETAIQWIQSFFTNSYYKRPAMASAILRLIGRLQYSLVGFTGMLIAVTGLTHQEVNVRDSAVRALESWGGPSSRIALENHVGKEPVPRLARYIKQVIKDLSQ